MMKRMQSAALPALLRASASPRAASSASLKKRALLRIALEGLAGVAHGRVAPRLVLASTRQQRQRKRLRRNRQGAVRSDRPTFCGKAENLVSVKGLAK